MFKIGNRKIGKNYPPLIVAEIGINHEGKMWKVKKMIDDAYEAGCECVKFQYHIPEKEMIENNTIPGNAQESIWNIIKRCTLSHKNELEIFNYVKKKKFNLFEYTFFQRSCRKIIRYGCLWI